MTVSTFLQTFEWWTWNRFWISYFRGRNFRKQKLLRDQKITKFLTKTFVNSNFWDEFRGKHFRENQKTLYLLGKKLSQMATISFFFHYTLPPFTFSSRGTRNQMRSGDQLTSNCTSIKVNSPLSRVDSKSLHWTCRRKSDGRARFQFCHDITSNGEHACIANTEEKKEKSYHDQCHNQKSRHSWNVFW